MSYTKKAFWGLGILAVCQLLSSVLAYVLRLVLVRSLTPAEYGLVYAVLAFVGFFAFTQTLGFPDALVQRMPTLKRARDVETAFVSLLVPLLIVNAVVLLLLVLSADWLATTYFQASAAKSMLMICGIFIFLSPIEVILLAIFQGSGRMGWYGGLLLARAVLLLLSTMGFLYFGYGVLSPILAYVAINLLIPLVHLPLLLRLYPGFGVTKARIDWSLFRSSLAFGIPVMLTGIMGFFLGSIDTFFLTLYRPLTDVALYNVALPTASLLWFLSGVIYAAMLPITSDMLATKKLDVLKDGVGNMYLYLLILVLPFTIVLLLFPDVVLNALFGAEYLGAALALQLLVSGGVFYVFSMLNASIITGMGHPRRVLFSMAAAAAVNVVLDILLIPTYGVAGSAVATLVAFIVLFVMNYVALRSLVTFRLPWGRMLRVLVASLLFGVALMFLRQELALPLWWKMSLTVIIAGALYVLMLFALRAITIAEIRSFASTVLRK